LTSFRTSCIYNEYTRQIRIVNTLLKTFTYSIVAPIITIIIVYLENVRSPETQHRLGCVLELLFRQARVVRAQLLDDGLDLRIFLKGNSGLPSQAGDVQGEGNGCGLLFRMW
jgi:hypothetical protein